MIIRASSALIAGALTAMTLSMMVGGPLAGIAGKYIGVRYTAILAAVVNLFGLYLISDLSSGVTGEVHYVDAGYNIIGW